MTPQELTLYVFFPLAAYLLGSIPFAFVIGKAHHIDIRTVGSKNIGATNLGRTLGKKYFWQAFLLDALKSFVPTLTISILLNHWITDINAQNSMAVLSYQAVSILRPHPQGLILTQLPLLPSWTPLLTGVAAVLGHLFPVYLKFKGGKGVSTGFGAVLGFFPIFTLAGIFGAMVFVGVLLVHRYISLASLVGAFAFSLAATLFAYNNLFPEPLHTYLPPENRVPILAAAWLFTVMIIVRHRGNIGRLMKGTEPQIGQRQVEKSRLK